MLKHYLHVFYRNLFKNKSYTLSNIIGLSFSIGAIILVLLYIRFELSFDQFHQDKNQTYRVSVRSFHEGKYEAESHVFVPPVGVALKQEFAEVQNYTRYATARELYVMHNDKAIKIKQNIYADATFFNLFSFKVIQGDKNTFLQQPNTIVLTKSTAQQLFGKTDVLGKNIVDNNKNQYTITGIVANPPKNSSIQFNSLISFATLYQNHNNYMGWNGGNQYVTYIQLEKGVSSSSFEKKLPDFFWRHINKDLAQYNVKYEAYLQPLSDIHLKYDSSYKKLYFFGIIAFLIWLIASFNFVNLSMAYYSKKAKLIGVRKTLGAGRADIAKQFMLETFLIVLIAVILGVVLANFLTPYYRQLMQTKFYGIDFTDKIFLGMLFGLWLLTGLSAGIYPAFYLSKTKITHLFKNTVTQKKKHFNLQNILIILQFMVAVSLIIFTLVIKQQLQFINNKDLGFSKEQILIIPLEQEKSGKQTALIKEKLQDIPGISGIAASSGIPINNFTSNGYFIEGMNTPAMVHVLDVDADYFNTYGIKLKKGRFFSNKYTTDKKAFVVNEAFVDTFGDQLGKTVKRDGEHQVIGVVKDFNFASIREHISPLIITQAPWQQRYNYLSVKINTKDYAAILKKIETIWHQINPEWVFEYSFLDQEFEKVYRSEYNMMQLFTYFSILAILIATMGLFSLSAFTIEQRTKEIGIRKVLGASISDIIKLVSKKYVVIVLIANLLVWPIIYELIKNWLQNFASRIDISILYFVIAGALSMGVALLSVSIKGLSVARQNPTLSLRNE